MESSAALMTASLGDPERARTKTRAVPWYLIAVLFASTSVTVGIIWDISWHQTIGRDTFWTPAHMATYVGGLTAGLACGWLALKTTFAGSERERGRSVQFWGFRAPLGAWVAIWGTFAMLTSAPFDDWWHNAYGLDVQILSPPHVVLALGIITIQIGAILMALSWQNRSRDQNRRPLAIAYAYAGGMALAMMAVLITEYSFPNDQHSPLFYWVTAGMFPIALFSNARAGLLRWPATATALMYTGLVLAMMWILPLFPAQAMLAPIHQTVTRMNPPEFPLLLVVPAFGLDLLLRQRSGDGPVSRWRDWWLAAVGAVVFVVLLTAVQWPFAEFLLSDGARNYFFQGDTWGYSARPGAWRTQFWPPNSAGGPTFLETAPRIAFAIPLAFVSGRLGLWWGNWMTRVRR